jgi:BirA family biotin operon repressor/biotin-[acetyl-CoA-carboxylase] ligase
MIARADALPREFEAAFADAGFRFGRLGTKTLFFREIDSTNNVATALAASGPSEGAIVIADAQTSGRGRRGRSWFSPPGSGLYVSIVLEPARAASDRGRALALVTLAAGVAVAEGVEHATGFAPAIKWPNDLMAGPRKLAGILAEGIVRPSETPGNPQVNAVVLGYGINVAHASFPAELGDRATSLETELGRAIDRARLCAETVASIAARYDDLIAGRFDAILDAWHARAPGSRGARVEWETPDGVRSGITAGVDPMGALLVRVGGGTERLIAGEVTWSR